MGFGRLFEVIRDGVIVADAATQRIVLWNPAASDIFGYSPSEALDGMRVEDLVPEHLKAAHRAGTARYRETGRGRYSDANKLLDLPAVAKSGKTIRAELSLSPVAAKDVGGGPYVPAIVRDVTERNRTEEFAAQLLRHLSGEPVAEPDAALAGVPSEPRGPLGEARSVELTAREPEVLRRLASGKTNRRMAQEMPVGSSSVKAHVARVSASSGSPTARRRRRCGPWRSACFPNSSSSSSRGPGSKVFFRATRSEYGRLAIKNMPPDRQTNPSGAPILSRVVAERGTRRVLRGRFFGRRGRVLAPLLTKSKIKGRDENK